jgi:hypothetical protein
MYLPVKYVDIAKAIAKRQGISFSELMRNAMVKHIREEIGRIKAGTDDI